MTTESDESLFKTSKMKHWSGVATWMREIQPSRPRSTPSRSTATVVRSSKAARRGEVVSSQSRMMVGMVGIGVGID